MAKGHAPVNLVTNIVIGGKVLSSFNQIGNQLEALGSRVERIGARIRELETESVDIYRNYEDQMLGAKYALSAQYKSVRELNGVMSELDEYAAKWASTTIFHTDDVAKAINEAAHAGWNFDEIITAIPNAMYIAQAGGLDLSQGLDYLIKMMNSTGTEFDKMTTLIDQWSMASNLSATNIGEMGEAFMSLGASAQFADSTNELFALLAVLADVGTTGSEAGTALRGAMVRIIAPTMKAEAAVDLLGIDAAELEEVLAETNVSKAAKELEGMGFSAYDAEGKLKPMITIFHDLYDNIKDLDEASQNEILSAIFPTRNISTAKSFIAAVANGHLDEIFGQIGESEGYAAQGADIMMSGLTGAIETLKSKWEEFERKIGETLAPAIESVAGWLGNIVDYLNNMDPAAMNMLVSALTSLAAAGPALMLLGGALKTVALMGTPGGILVTAAIGVSALNAAYNDMKKQDFGTLELNLDELGGYVDSLQTKFDTQMASIAGWESALESAQKAYTDASTALADTMLTDVLEGKELTAEDKANLTKYAGSMYDAVWDGLNQAKNADKTFLAAIFADGTGADQTVGDAAGQIVGNWYNGMYDEARTIGEELRKKMTEALADNTLDEQERLAIQASVNRYNEILAEIQRQTDSEAYYKQMYKAQTVSEDSIEAFIKENTEKAQADIESLNDAYATEWAHAKAAYDYAIANGGTWTDSQGKVHGVSSADWALFERGFERRKASAQQEIYDKYGDINARAFGSLMNDSEAKLAWDFLNEMRTNGLTANDVAGMGLSAERAKAIDDSMQALIRLQEGSFLGFGRSNLYALAQNNAQNAGMSDILSMWNASRSVAFQLGQVVNSPAPVNIGKNQFYGTNPMEVNIDTSKAEAAVQSLKDKIAALTTTVNLKAVVSTGGSLLNKLFGARTYAEGGRADMPSIFAEAGAEWAIPEEHSARTAELLNAAREASGFSWGDLIARNGGLNAGGGTNVVLNYSPTVNANDANGVAQVLEHDKDKLLKMVKDMLALDKVRSGAEVFA